MRHSFKPTFALLTGVFTLWSASPPVNAQDALGGGNVLDSNLNATTGRFNTPRPVENYRDRNLIITGNVAGGREFRGRVGYLAENDFRGRLGSNDLFDFRRETAYSNPSLIQLGSTFEQLRFGQGMGLVEVPRSGAVSNLPAVDRVGDEYVIQLDSTRLRLDRAALAASYNTRLQDIAAPRIVGVTFAEDGSPLLLNASSLRGLTVERADRSLGLIGLTALDAARVRYDVEIGLEPTALGAPFETRFPGMVEPTGERLPETDGETPALDQSRSGVPEDYGRILTRVAERFAGAQRLDSSMDGQAQADVADQYQALRLQLTRGRSSISDQPPGAPDALTQGEAEGLTSEERLAGVTPGASRAPGSIVAGRTPGVEDIEPAFPQTPSSRDFTRDLTPPRQPGDSTQRQADATDPARFGGYDRPTQAPMTMADYGVILRHGERIDRLAGEVQTRFNEILAGGEQELRQGDYFLAERRFDHALRFTPGHPLASAGMAHAQLGSGLYLSSSLTLRNLFRRQPEMIDATYAPELLPTPDRLEEAVATIRSRMDEQADRGAYGLLLAYIGRQTGERDLIEEGLTEMAQAEPENPLVTLLQSVWLGESDEPQAAPQQPPAQPTQPDPNK